MRKDTTTGLFAIVLGCIYLLAITRFPEARAGDATGPKFFPVMIGAICVLAGAVLLRVDKKKKSEKVQWGFAAEREIWIKIAISTVLGIIYGMVIEDWGYLLATTAFLFCILFMINRGRHLQNIIFAVGFPVITYFGFAVMLHLSLPRGIIENLLPF